MSEGQKSRNETNGIKLAENMQDRPNRECRIIICAKNMGSWLIARGTIVIGKVLLDTEPRDFLCAQYNLSPTQPPETM